MAAAGLLLALGDRGMLGFRGCSAEAAEQNGTIAGRVMYDGAAIPDGPVIPVTADRRVCGTAPRHERPVIAGSDGGLAEAVVYLNDAPNLNSASHTHAEVRFDQRGCRYIPRVVAIPAGGTIDVVNSDGILHSIHTASKLNPPLNIAQPGFKKVIKIRLSKPEPISVSCDQHPWMKGYWFVAPSRFVAVTDTSGKFRFADVPPGRYTLSVWHPRLGKKARKIQVLPGAVAQVDFALP